VGSTQSCPQLPVTDGRNQAEPLPSSTQKGRGIRSSERVQVLDFVKISNYLIAFSEGLELIAGPDAQLS